MSHPLPVQHLLIDATAAVAAAATIHRSLPRARGGPGVALNGGIVFVAEALCDTVCVGHKDSGGSRRCLCVPTQRLAAGRLPFLVDYARFRPAEDARLVLLLATGTSAAAAAAAAQSRL